VGVGIRLPPLSAGERHQMSHEWIAPISLADVVWPSLILEGRLLSVFPISAGLVVEWLVLYFGGFGLSWKKSIVVDLVMNAVSSTVGVFLIPILGVVWELFPGSLINWIFHVGTFNPVAWIATFLFSACASTAIEAVVVRKGFKIPLDWKRFWMLFGANAVSTAIAFVSLWTHPPQFG
jgi:hypothetical protein